MKRFDTYGFTKLSNHISRSITYNKPITYSFYAQLTANIDSIYWSIYKEVGKSTSISLLGKIVNMFRNGRIY